MKHTRKGKCRFILYNASFNYNALACIVAADKQGNLEMLRTRVEPEPGCRRVLRKRRCPSAGRLECIARMHYDMGKQ